MAALGTDQPSLGGSAETLADAGNNNDPFVSASGASNHHRYSHFDTQLFALGPAASPDQAKRALEAHLAETERRIQEASKLGTALVQQRKDLSDRLKEVEKQQGEGDISPELQQKLVDLEKEYNEVGRESARAFLSKARVPSNELGGSPFVGDGKRSVSPSKFESQATNSPSKLTVPNRKQRNQPSSRVHDIEFATEISTSLLAQVRHLQALLAEKDENLRSVTLEKSKLETEAEGLQQRLRALDESEHRYKDENWNLETQIHEHIANAKEAAEREKKLTQSLNVLQAEKIAAQKELDEIKVIHSKLVEDHATAVKHHDVELGSAKRSIAMVENERGALQRKIEDLTSQNQELAVAVAQQRGRQEEQGATTGLSDEDFETATDNITPEHSPPPSPVKGTPRHTMLESETLKSSLHHAHRMIQSLKNNIHREKTEKLELKRLLQDARDELDMRRGDGNLVSASNKRSRKADSKEFKKPLRPGQLGSVRRSEIEIDEINWEDHDQSSPTHSTAVTTARVAAGAAAGGMVSSADQSEATSDAFETANERGTETDDFHTGAENLSGSDDLTETEDGPSGTLRSRPTPLNLTKRGNRESFQSTASTSGDDYAMDDLKTPIQSQPQRFRLKMNRNSARRSRVASEEPHIGSSPASFATSSNNGTPQASGQTLFAELGDLNGSDEDESVDGTPSRKSIASPASVSVTKSSATPSRLGQSPHSLSATPKPIFVDSGVMTDAWSPAQPAVETTVPTHLSVVPSIVEISESERSSFNNDSTMSQDKPFMSEAATRWHEEQIRKILRASSNLSPDSRPISGVSGVSMYSDSSSAPETNLDERLSKFPPPPTSPGPQMERVPEEIASALTMSAIQTEHFEPSKHSLEPISAEMAKPTAPLTYSSIQAVSTEPNGPEVPVRSGKRVGVFMPRDITSENISATENPETPKPGFLGSVFGWNKNRSPATPVIAEDETRQSPSDSPLNETPESQRPFKEISSNTNERAPKRPKVDTIDESSQTTLTSLQIEKLLSAKTKHVTVANETQPVGPLSPPRATDIPPVLRIRKSQESVGSVTHARAKMSDPDYVHDTVLLKRPGSSGSNRVTSSDQHPPLPNNHQEVIAAATQRVGSSSGGQGTMGPPLVPASAYKNNTNFRPRTPSSQAPGSPTSTRGGTTPRAIRVTSEVQSPPDTAKSRRSSVSSFASEVDTRFNLRQSGMLPQGFGSNTDPRMIQAITQTMIGEYLWKYTRKAGRGEMSENRHRRYFWVHPYTRTLYWSDRDPSSGGRVELKAKSVQIEAVRVVTDDNPMPPGLHRKSLVILTPGRAVKFTAATGQRHETWFNALSYLLLRTEGNTDHVDEAVDTSLTREDVDEFNPGYGRSAARRAGPPSLSSYNSRTTRNESPVRQSVRVSLNPPTLMHESTSSRPSQGTFSRLSNYWKPGGTFNSRRSRASVAGHGSIYDASEVHDSAEDLREIIERQDRESDKLENVRACCDGKHDVGSLSHSSKKKRHSHSQPPTPHRPTSSRPGASSRQSVTRVTE